MSAPFDENAPRLGPEGAKEAAASRGSNQTCQGSGSGNIIPNKAEAGNDNALVDPQPDTDAKPQSNPAPKPDTDAALDFLAQWRAGGPWVLTAIPPDGGATETRTFDATSRDDMHAWIDARQGKWNLYFSVNDLAGPVTSKAAKSDVAFARALHVDIDPRVGEDIVSERERALRLLWAYARPPTVIVDSGGGYQGFWLLNEPVAIPSAERAQDGGWAKLEGRNRRIEYDLGADACHDMSRIMRLPGTINVPGDKKRKKGRVEALARVVEADWSRTYTLDAFPLAETGEAKADGPSPTVKVTAAPAADVELDALSISDKLRALIVQGGDPDDPAKWADRSAAVWHVVCELIRSGVEDDLILGILLDPALGISAHVRDQPRPEPYARRQVERARDEAIAPELRELNDRFTVLEAEGGKCRVLEFVEQPTGVRGKTRRVPQQQSFEDFRNRFMNRKVTVGKDKDGNEVKMKLGDWWLNHPMRRQYHSLTFQPLEGPVVGERLNLWEGFSVLPRAGDWSLMRAHIRDVIAAGDEASAKYILKWLAWTVQNPDQQAEVALVMRGIKGTGKGLFGREVAGLFGQHGLHTGGTELLTGRFNQHFRDCCLLFADEVMWDGDKKAEAKLKTFLTEPTLVIEGKGKDAVTWPNMLHVLISSNDDWVIPAGAYERRFAIFDVSPVRHGDRPYFKALFEELNRGGREAMLQDLLDTNLEGWHPREGVPETAALNDQKARGLDPIRAFVLDMLHEGSVPTGCLSFRRKGEKVELDGRGTDAQPFVSTENVAEMISKRTKHSVTAKAVSAVLDALKATKDARQRPRGYILPLLKEARATWNDQPDLPPQDWSDADDDWVPGGPDSDRDFKAAMAENERASNGTEAQEDPPF